MAGSFGYDPKHFDLSMKIGELVLFPQIRSENPEVIIAAPGTSCRHQILDGTGRLAKHPIEILNARLKRPTSSTGQSSETSPPMPSSRRLNSV